MQNTPSDSDIVILVPHNGMGLSNVEQQQNLFGKYLTLLIDGNYLPAAFCFYTEGVRLVAKGSPVIEQLKILESKGVRLLVCLTCLKEFNLIDQLNVGIIASMPDIIEAQWRAKKVITL